MMNKSIHFLKFTSYRDKIAFQKFSFCILRLHFKVSFVIYRHFVQFTRLSHIVFIIASNFNAALHIIQNYDYAKHASTFRPALQDTGIGQQCRALTLYLLLAWTICWTSNPVTSDFRHLNATWRHKCLPWQNGGTETLVKR